jgi:hypothetical protein
MIWHRLGDMGVAVRDMGVVLPRSRGGVLPVSLFLQKSQIWVLCGIGWRVYNWNRAIYKFCHAFHGRQGFGRKIDTRTTKSKFRTRA